MMQKNYFGFKFNVYFLVIIEKAKGLSVKWQSYAGVYVDRKQRALTRPNYKL